MTLIIQSQFFLKTIDPSPKSLGEHFLGAKKSLSYHAGLWKPPPPLPAHPFPLQPNQAHEVVGRGGRTPKSSSSQRRKSKLHLKTRASEESIYSKSSLTQTVSRQEGAAHLNIHTFLHLKTSLLYFKGKIKDPPNPFQKNPIIIITTIIKNPIRNHKEALRV